MVLPVLLQLLLFKIHNYEPGLYRLIMSLCGVYKDEDFKKIWLPRLDACSFINPKEFFRLSSIEQIKLFGEILPTHIKCRILSDYGLFKRDIKVLSKLNIGKCTVMIYYYKGLDNDRPSAYIEFIPKNKQHDSMIYKGFFVNKMMARYKLCVIETKTTNLNEYKKMLERYYDILTGDV